MMRIRTHAYFCRSLGHGQLPFMPRQPHKVGLRLNSSHEVSSWAIRVFATAWAAMRDEAMGYFSNRPIATDLHWIALFFLLDTVLLCSAAQVRGMLLWQGLTLRQYDLVFHDGDPAEYLRLQPFRYLCMYQR